MVELLTKLEQARAAGSRDDIGNAIKGYEEIIKCKLNIIILSRLELRRSCQGQRTSSLQLGDHLQGKRVRSLY